MKTALIAIVAIIGIGGLVYFLGMKDQAATAAITNFEECAAAGNPIMESNPRQCRTEDGRTFTEEVAVGDERVGELGEDEQATESKTVSGTVTSVDLEGMAVDGPGLINISTNEGGEAVIAVPSMGILLCAAKDNIADISTIKTGNKIEARGSVGPEGQIVPCESAEHFVRVAQ